MKNSINLSGFFGGIGSFIRRFHTILFFLIVSGGLFAAIVSLLSIIELSSTTASSSDQVVNGSFDEDTIRRLEQNTPDKITPGARPSPFVE